MTSLGVQAEGLLVPLLRLYVDNVKQQSLGLCWPKDPLCLKIKVCESSRSILIYIIFGNDSQNLHVYNAITQARRFKASRRIKPRFKDVRLGFGLARISMHIPLQELSVPLRKMRREIREFAARLDRVESGLSTLEDRLLKLRDCRSTLDHLLNDRLVDICLLAHVAEESKKRSALQAELKKVDARLKKFSYAKLMGEFLGLGPGLKSLAKELNLVVHVHHAGDHYLTPFARMSHWQSDTL